MMRGQPISSLIPLRGEDHEQPLYSQQHSLDRVRLLSCRLIVFSQTSTAVLQGTVTDPAGALVPRAAVKIQQLGTGLERQTLTGESGTYALNLLPVGTYIVTVEASGFKQARVQSVVLEIGQTRTLDVKLEVGEIQQTIEVEGTTQPLDRNSAVIGTVIGTQQIREIPLNGRHWASLMALAPGAINTGDGSQQTIRFVGRARDDNNWTFDGLDATGVKDPRQEAALRLVISTDTIAEFRVNSTLYSAESGSGAGGQVNLVSKAGSNEFHGSVFEFFRNDYLDARNPFDSSKQPFRLNQFGGNIGGPIIRNRTFFFTNYEGLQQRVTSRLTNDVPSAAFRARATSATPRQLLDAYPVGNLRTSNADIDQAQANGKQSWRENSASLRIDHRFNDSNTFFARYNVDDGVIFAPRSVIESDRQNDNFRPSNFVMQFQRVFSPNVVNEWKIGSNRSTLNRFTYGPLPESMPLQAS